MSRELIIRPEAEAEIDEAYDWYEARSRGLGADFLLSVAAVLRAARRTIRPHEMLAKHFELSSRDTPRPRRHRGSDHPEPPGEGALKHRGDLRPVASEASVGLVARREQAKIQTARFLAIEGDVDAEVLGFAYVTLCLTAQDDPGSPQERYSRLAQEAFRGRTVSAWSVFARGAEARAYDARDPERAYRIDLRTLREAIRLGEEWLVALQRVSVMRSALRTGRDRRIVRFQIGRIVASATHECVGHTAAALLQWCAEAWVELAEYTRADACINAARPLLPASARLSRLMVDYELVKLRFATGELAQGLSILKTALPEAIAIGVSMWQPTRLLAGALAGAGLHDQAALLWGRYLAETRRRGLGRLGSDVMSDPSAARSRDAIGEARWEALLHQGMAASPRIIMEIVNEALEEVDRPPAAGS